MSEVMTLPSAPRSNASAGIEEVFDAELHRIARAGAKANPYVRALMLKFTGKLPPAECETFEQFKEWVETTAKMKHGPAKPSRLEDAPLTTASRISVEFSEHGIWAGLLFGAPFRH